jgi:hypothetical protein
MKSDRTNMIKHRAARLIILLCLVIAIASCGSNNLPQYTALGDLRLLTIIADQPEVNPGTTVTFTPVLSDVNGQGRVINFAVQGCIDPGVGIGAEPVCVNPDPSSLLTGTVAIAPGASMTYTGPVSSFSLTMPDAATIFNGINSVDQYNGVAYLVFYTISVPNGPSVISFLRVTVSSSNKTQKNQNPVMSSVDINDSPVTGILPMPTSSVNLSVNYPPSSAETYSTMQPDGSFTAQTEELISTWFISDGSLDTYRTIGETEDSWTPPQPQPVGRGSVILVVTRDGRGGGAYQEVELN